MSASSLVTIFCDAPSCGQWDQYGVGWTAAEARRNLRSTKWQLNVPDPDGGGQRLDFCPAHATTPSPSSPRFERPTGRYSVNPADSSSEDIDPFLAGLAALRRGNPAPAPDAR